MYRWNIAEHDQAQVARIAREFNIGELTAKLLINRGYVEKEQIELFLNKSRDLLHDPFLMRDIEKGIDRVYKALVNKEKVMVYGDYDVDGISSTCVMYIYLKKLGIDVCYYIPDRFEEGYGINNEAIKKAKENKINLIITVDTGITAVEEIVYAKELEIDIVITDHHECPKILPDAAAVINPKRQDCQYPFKELAGVGVAFKFISAYNIKYGSNKTYDGDADFESYYEFTAMGTVSDIMTLTDENRILVDIGLKSMRVSKNFGINAILESYYKFKDRKNISTDIIGFYISPRINAAGRLAKADRAVELFLTESKTASEIIADELSALNKKRQETEKDIFAQAENELSHIPDNIKEKKKIIILYNDNWNQGVIGIVASKLSEKYNKVFILFAKDASGAYKGSCRSVKNINITEMLAMCSDILIKYGGHERAAGLSVEYENIEELDKRLNDCVDKSNIEIEDENTYDIECEVRIEKMTCVAARELEMLEPFGSGNPVPMFTVIGCKIINIMPIGENKHIKIEFTCEKSAGFAFEAVYFGVEADKFEFNKYDIADIACNIGINEFMGKEKVQYIIRDMRINKEYKQKYLLEKDIYNKFKNKEKDLDLDLEESDIPDRGDFKSVYIFLLGVFKKNLSYDMRYDISKLESKYSDGAKNKMTRFKFRVILDIFNEMGIIHAEHDFDNINKIKINSQSVKINLDNSEIYQRLRDLIK